MCGISGFVGDPARVQRWGDPARILRAINREIAHRGPDDEGYFEQPGVWLGHRRLSIIDLAGGHQPLASACGSALIIFNGEIYNFAELRDELSAAGRPFLTNSDTEVIVQGYLHWGRDVLGKLNGMFAFALWDRRDQSLFVARDRLGQKPLYFAERDGMLLFGSELKVMLRHPAIERTVDPIALRQYLLYDAVPAPGCMVRGVRKLEAGAFFVWRGGRIEAHARYWDIPFGGEELDGDDDALVDQFWRTFSDAVRLRLRSDVPLGVFLSGGIDSTAVVVAMAEHLPAESIQTFSVAFRDPSFDESSHARTVANHVGTTHYEETLDPETVLERLPGILRTLDEPLADNSLLPTYLLSEFTRRRVTVALGGDGGDELWLGYPTFYAHRLARFAEKVPAVARRLAQRAARLLPVDPGYISFDYKVKRMLLGLDYPSPERHFVWIGSFDPAHQRTLLSAEVLAAAPDESVFAPVRDHESRVHSPRELDTIAYLYAKIYMGDDILTKVDRASMAHALEARAPLLDYRVAELAAKMPLRAKLRGRQTKWVLRQALQGRVPQSILQRPKQGFGVPIASWLKGPLRPWAEALLDRDRIAADGFFNPDAVGRLWADHQAGRVDHRKHLWSILVFQLWLDTWLRSPVEPEARAR